MYFKKLIKKHFFWIPIIFLISNEMAGQNKWDFNGQVSSLVNYNPKGEYDLFAGVRYIPELTYSLELDSINKLDFEASVNLSGSVLFKPFYKSVSTQGIDPYRLWIRYTRNKFELRGGLQKIDFGSASIIRPLQWFNQIDARDPLQLTNGVYGLLSRYYFKNNANIWTWVLYGNDKLRGFDSYTGKANRPEVGGRIQYPFSKGEMAISYNNRKVDLSLYFPNSIDQDEIIENKIGFDTKWDLVVGFWIETSYARLNKTSGYFTNQVLANVGMDYTFSIGNGLTTSVEHLINSMDEHSFEFKNNNHFTACTMSYPIGFFDSLSLVSYYSWTTKDPILLLNYEHQFKNFTGYLMGYFNPETNVALPENKLVNSFSGFGIRVLAVINH